MLRWLNRFKFSFGTIALLGAVMYIGRFSAAHELLIGVLMLWVVYMALMLDSYHWPWLRH